jgi:hypothetical protein
VGAFFTFAYKIKLRPIHISLTTGLIYIIIQSIYAVATTTIYLIEVNTLILHGSTAAGMVYMCHYASCLASYKITNAVTELGGKHGIRANENALYNNKRPTHREQDCIPAIGSAPFSITNPHLIKSIISSNTSLDKHRYYLASLTVTAIILFMGGINLQFLVWPGILFTGLLLLYHLGAGEAVFAVALGGVIASFIGQTEWGYAATIIVAVTITSLLNDRRYMVFGVLGVCLALGQIDSWVILGINPHCMVMGAASFVAINLKFHKEIGEWFSNFTDGSISDRDIALQSAASEMGALARMYATYVDGRSILASVFTMTQELLESTQKGKGSMSLISSGASDISRHASTPAPYSRGNIHLQSFIAQTPARGQLCGDSACFAKLGDNRHAIIISDGMGKGKKAAMESQTVTRTVITLLKSGASVDTTLQIINSIMAIKSSDDSFATMDLAIIDKAERTAKFYKIGGAPTLIRRGEELFHIQTSHVPLGIVNGLEIQYRELKLRRGDMIIMMSDGVSDISIDNIARIIRRARSTNPETMSHLILGGAREHYGDREKDDLTVVVTKVG